MSNSEGSDDEKHDTVFLYEHVVEEEASSIEVPMSEWSSLEWVIEEPNLKRNLYSQGLYSPGSGEICTKQVIHSDSTMQNHPYYKYPAVTDPGIEEALLDPQPQIVYGENGQELYLVLCDEMKVHPIGIFYRNLLTTEINLSYYGIQVQAVRAMTMALQYNKTVRRLNLSDNFLNDDACYHLGELFATNVAIEELILTGCRIGRSGILRLGQQFSINRSLVLIGLDRNDFGDEGGETLAQFIEQGATIPRMSLSYNKLGKKTALKLAEVLEFKNKLTHLDLSRNNFLLVPIAVKMLMILGDSTVLEELNLAWNSFEGERIGAAIKKIVSIPTLTTLNLSNNKLCGAAIELIISNLIRAPRLKILDISNNPLSPENALAVLNKMLLPRVKIQKLLMDNINVNKNFEPVLEKVREKKFRKNFSITYGYVLHNWKSLGPDARELILKRAERLGQQKRPRKDVPLYMLQLSKEYAKPVPVKNLLDRIGQDGVPLDSDFITELSLIFPGPTTAKSRSVNLKLVEEYIRRLWPDKKASSITELVLAPAIKPQIEKAKAKK